MTNSVAKLNRAQSNSCFNGVRFVRLVQKSNLTKFGVRFLSTADLYGLSSISERMFD